MNYSEWIGKTQQQADTVTQAGIDRFCATLDLLPGQTAAPAGYHWCLCLPDTDTSQLGRDGHPLKGSFIPPLELPRRMWAATEVEYLAPLSTGANIVRHSHIAAVNEKTGKTGELVFVEIDHATFADDVLSIKERQTIVYREASTTPMILPKSDAAMPQGWDIVEVINPTPSLLFRYSSLTFNSHRIHYDLPYAKEQELYPELVVQAPLMATQALQLAEKQGKITSFSFRALSPAFCNQPLYLVANLSQSGGEICTVGADGRTCLRVNVTFSAER
jgi:3-methylfumaryl-CoA hydratase